MAVTLTWRKASWPKKTYYADHGKLTYRVDYAGSFTGWRAMGWDDGTYCFYKDGPTMKAMRQAAVDHATKHGN